MSKSLLSAVIAAFLLLGLPILAGDRLPAALAQIAVSFTEWTVPTKGSHPHDHVALPVLLDLSIEMQYNLLICAPDHDFVTRNKVFNRQTPWRAGNTLATATGLKPR
jgi:hypothetical protein